MVTFHGRRLRWISAPAVPAERGFTLMEVMVALAVVAIALLAVYRMHAQTLFMETRGRFDTVAAMLARQKLADLDADPTKAIGGDSGDFGTAHPGYGWKTESEPVASDLLKEGGPLLQRITVTITLDGDKAQLQVITYRQRYE